MASCNTCAKEFGFFTKDYGCPLCKYSFCKNCLKNQIVGENKKKINVCLRCFNFKDPARIVKVPEIAADLLKIEDGAIADPILEPISLKPVDDIADKLTDLKSPDVIGLTSDEAIAQRLAKLKGIEHKDYSNQNLLFGKETRSAEEQVRDLLKQFVSEQSIDAEAKLPDSELGQGNTVDIEDIERRLALLRGVPYDPNALKKRMDEGRPEETEAEETSRIVKQYLEEAKLDDLVLDPEEQELIEGVPQAPKKDTEELPFCEICNEDAVCRCVGCDGNLFCKPCFKEFHDEEDYKDHKVKDYKAPKSVD